VIVKEVNKPMEHPKKPESTKEREPMKVAEVGHVGEVLQGGGGKLSVTGGDPGENRKQKGGGS
jgi:hypothetical protein